MSTTSIGHGRAASCATLTIALLMLFSFSGCEDASGDRPDEEPPSGTDADTDADVDIDADVDGDDSEEAEPEDPFEYEDGEHKDGFFVDHGAGLIWENPPRHQGMGGLGPNWNTAKTYCDNLYLASSDQWRLPTVDELRTLLRNVSSTEAGGVCPTSEECTHQNRCNKDDNGNLGFSDACFGCVDETREHLKKNDCQELGDGDCYWIEGLEGQCAAYWTATANTLPAAMSMAMYYVRFNTGFIGSIFKTENEWVRCVKDVE